MNKSAAKEISEGQSCKKQEKTTSIKAQNVQNVTEKPSDEKNEMSEIESAMKDCRINTVEENIFYKVIKNDNRKSLGCVALQNIKAGTIILKEKPQCVPKIFTKWDPSLMLDFTQDNITPDYLFSLLNSYFSMSKSCREDFMNLKNQIIYMTDL